MHLPRTPHAGVDSLFAWIVVGMGHRLHVRLEDARLRAVRDRHVPLHLTQERHDTRVPRLAERRRVSAPRRMGAVHQHVAKRVPGGVVPCRAEVAAPWIRLRETALRVDAELPVLGRASVLADLAAA